MHLMFDVRVTKRPRTGGHVHIHGQGMPHDEEEPVLSAPSEPSKRRNTNKSLKETDIHKDPLFMVSTKPLRAKANKDASTTIMSIGNMFHEKERMEEEPGEVSVIEVIDDSEDEEYAYGSVEIKTNTSASELARNPTQIFYDSQYIEEASLADYGSDYTDTHEDKLKTETPSTAKELSFVNETRNIIISTKDCASLTEPKQVKNHEKISQVPSCIKVRESENTNEVPKPQKLVTLHIKCAKDSISILPESKLKASRLKGKPLTLIVNSNGVQRRRVGLSRRSNVVSLHGNLRNHQ